MYKLDNFLCCCSLERGGLIIGALSLIVNILGFLTCIGGIVLFFTNTCVDLTEKECFELNLEHFVLFFFLAIFFFAFIVYSCKLIRGVGARDHWRVFPMIIYFMAWILVSVSVIVLGTKTEIFEAVLIILFSFYCFFTLGSLFAKFELEYKQKFPKY